MSPLQTIIFSTKKNAEIWINQLYLSGAFKKQVKYFSPFLYLFLYF